MKSSRTLSIIFLVCVMLIWGSTFVVTKTALDRVPPILFAFARLAVASACLLIYAASTRQLTLRRPIPWGVLFGMAATGVTLYYIGFNLALRYTSASQAALVQSSIPIVTAGFAIVFLQEPLTSRRLLGIALAVAGVIAMFFRATPNGEAPQPWLGNLIMLGCVISWSSYTILAKRMAAAAPVTLAMSITVIGTVLLALPAWLESRNSPLPHLARSDWLAIGYLGAFPSALCFVLYSNALRELEAGQVATFVNLVPLVGVVAGVVALGESVSSSALFGGALVLMGVWISTHRPRPD